MIGHRLENAYVSEGKTLVSKVGCEGSLSEAISKSIRLIGGFEKVINPGDEVLLKPNFNTADPYPGSSDPEFVKTAINLLYRHGAGKVVLGESSTMHASTRKALQRTGMLLMAEEAGAEVEVFDEGRWVDVPLEGKYLKRIGLAESALDADKVVYTCLMKTHMFATFTLSLKHAMGFTRPRHRIRMHLRKLQEKIADLNTIIHPDLIIMDGRKCFISGGPMKGEIRQPNVILASGDRIAIDIEALKILKSYDGTSLKKHVWEYSQIQRAAELNIGVKSEAEYEVIQ